MMYTLGVVRPLARFPGGNSGQDAKVPVQPHNIDPGKNRGKSDIQTESTGSSIEEEEDNNGGQQENLRESGGKNSYDGTVKCPYYVDESNF